MSHIAFPYVSIGMQTYPLKLKKSTIAFPDKVPPLKMKPLQNNILRGVDAVGSTALGVTNRVLVEAKKTSTHISQAGTASLALVKKYARTAFMGLIVLDALLVLNVGRIIVSPFSAVDQVSIAGFLAPSVSAADSRIAAVRHVPIIQTGTAGLMAALKDQGLSPAAFGTTKKSSLSVPGDIITLEGDSISVFEYPDQATASSEAFTLAQSLSGSAQKNHSFAARTHVYAKDSLVVFYLGNNTAITDALSAYAGKSLVTPPNENIQSVFEKSNSTSPLPA